MIIISDFSLPSWGEEEEEEEGEGEEEKEEEKEDNLRSSVGVGGSEGGVEVREQGQLVAELRWTKKQR